MTKSQALAEAKKIWGHSARLKIGKDRKTGKNRRIVGFIKFGKFFKRGDGSSWDEAITRGIKRSKFLQWICATIGCDNKIEPGRHYAYCIDCRLLKHKREFIANCLTPWCKQRFVVHAVSAKALADWPDKFCDTCRANFSSSDGAPRLKALKLQVEEGISIDKIIIAAAKDAFEAQRGRRGNMPDVIERLSATLGISRRTLRDWLAFFFNGMKWPDFKRKYICEEKCCTIVDVSRVTSGGRLSKYYPIDKFRKKGICSCPIRGDMVILVDIRPNGLSSENMRAKFGEAIWTKQLEIQSGAHTSLLDAQEEYVTT